MGRRFLFRNVLVTNAIILRKMIRKKRRFHVHPINQRRPQTSEFDLFYDLISYEDRFQQYFWMTKDQFYRLLLYVEGRFFLNSFIVLQKKIW